MLLRKVARIMRDMWIYFKKGHGGYFVFILGMLNFVVLQYNLFIERIPFLKQYFPHMLSFIILFSFIYFPLAIILGRFDFKRGSTMRQPFLTPYTQDFIESNIRLRKSLRHHYTGDNKAAIIELAVSEDVLLKWKKEM